MGYRWLLVFMGFLGVVKGGYRWLQIVTDGYRWLGMVKVVYEWLRMVTGGYGVLMITMVKVIMMEVTIIVVATV